jgi:hypothetical protein
MSSVPETTTASPTTSPLLPTSSVQSEDAQLILLRNNTAVVRSFESGDVTLQVPASAYVAGLRQLIVKTGLTPQSVGAREIGPPFSPFVTLSSVPAGNDVGAQPIVLCLATALPSGSDELCFATAVVPGGKWNCTDAEAFASDGLKCARIAALPGVRAFSFLARADVRASMTSSTTTSTLPTTERASESASVSRVCKVGEMENGVLCALNDDVKTAWDAFLALGDAIVGVVIGAIVLCVLCCCALIIFLWVRPSRADDEEAPAKAAQTKAEERAAISEFLGQASDDENDRQLAAAATQPKRKSHRPPKRDRIPRRKAERSASSSSSSVDDYHKYEMRVMEQFSSSTESSRSEQVAVEQSSEDEPSEQVVVYQEVAPEVVEAVVVAGGKKTPPPKKKKKTKSKASKKKAKPTTPSFSETDESNGSHSLEWAQVETAKQ